MLKRLSPLLLVCLLASCGKAPHRAAAGWTYDTNPIWPGAIYSFGDGETTRLVGRCHSRVPVFSVSGGQYAANAETFKLIVDGRIRDLPTFIGVDTGKALIVDDPASMNDMIEVRRSMTFQVGDWSRTAPAHPFIRRLSKDCERLASRLPA